MEEIDLEQLLLDLSDVAIPFVWYILPILFFIKFVGLVYGFKPTYLFIQLLIGILKVSVFTYLYRNFYPELIKIYVEVSSIDFTKTSEVIDNSGSTFFFSMNKLISLIAVTTAAFSNLIFLVLLVISIFLIPTGFVIAQVLEYHGIWKSSLKCFFGLCIWGGVTFVMKEGLILENKEDMNYMISLFFSSIFAPLIAFYGTRFTASTIGDPQGFTNQYTQTVKSHGKKSMSHAVNMSSNQAKKLNHFIKSKSYSRIKMRHNYIPPQLEGRVSNYSHQSRLPQRNSAYSINSTSRIGKNEDGNISTTNNIDSNKANKREFSFLNGGTRKSSTSIKSQESSKNYKSSSGELLKLSKENKHNTGSYKKQINTRPPLGVSNETQKKHYMYSTKSSQPKSLTINLRSKKQQNKSNLYLEQKRMAYVSQKSS